MRKVQCYKAVESGANSEFVRTVPYARALYNDEDKDSLERDYVMQRNAVSPIFYEDGLISMSWLMRGCGAMARRDDLDHSSKALLHRLMRM